jgi:hypothetical protein
MNVNNDNVNKDKIYFIEIPNSDLLSYKFLRFICIISEILIIKNVDNDKIKLNSYNNTNMTTLSISEIIMWMSHRKFVNNINSSFITTLCGDNIQIYRKKISRMIKKVVNWEIFWNDIDTKVTMQLANALCPQILFDKKIRQRNVKYLIDLESFDHGINNDSFLSCLDILMVMYLEKWLSKFQDEQEYIISKIPAVVGYVKHIRKEIFKSIGMY